jgi:hypothetical protein
MKIEDSVNNNIYGHYVCYGSGADFLDPHIDKHGDVELVRDGLRRAEAKCMDVIKRTNRWIDVMDKHGVGRSK